MAAKKKVDLVVLGSGPGGYPAAIKAAQCGLSVALIEAKELGGTCLNRGCIPSKTLIASAETLLRVEEAKEFGISVSKVSFDFAKMAARKDRIVINIRKGLEGLIQSNGIQVFRGHGKFVSPREIKVLGKDNAIISTEKTIIATGSEPHNMAMFPIDGKKIHDSTSLLEQKKLPKKLVIIGGGVIGCEFASLYRALGAEVVILELLPQILPMESKNVSEALTQAFKKRGIEIQTKVKVKGIKTTQKGVEVTIEKGKTIRANIALIAVGRSLNTSQIGLEKAGVLVNEDGIIPVNDRMETNVDGIYAIGDIASKWWLAHVASHQGIVAASNAAGEHIRMDYRAIPNVIFTHPEVGTVGMSLEQAKEKGYDATVGVFPFQALGKAQAAHQTEGFAQIVIDRKTGQILGAQVVGHDATTLVAEMAVAITNELTVECLTETIHAHPTLSEAWLEAAFLASGTPLHLPPKAKAK